jgi:anti-sigma regulatory factor (Ser/Thr protein kinase)
VNGSCCEQELILTIPGDSRYLAMMRAVVGEAVKVSGFDKQAGRDIVLALCEATSNIIAHCYKGQCKPITVRCLLAGDRLEIRLRDFGPKPDPACLRSRSLDDIRPGGLGIHMIRQTMDEVDYDFSHREGTELKLVKYRLDRKPDAGGKE